MRTSYLTLAFLSVALTAVAVSGCASDDCGDDILCDLDLGLDFGFAFTVITASSITASGAVDGAPVPTGPKTPWLSLTKDDDMDVVMAINEVNGSLDAEASPIVRLGGAFRVTKRSLTEAFEVSCAAPSNCPVEAFMGGTGPDAGADTTTEATLTVTPLPDGTVQIRVVTQSTLGDALDVTVVAPLGDDGRLIRE